MIKRIRNEILFFLAILVVLAFLMHSDLFTSPLERFSTMSEMGNYLHPFLWTFGVYLFIGVFRLIYMGINYLKNKKK